MLLPLALCLLACDPPGEPGPAEPGAVETGGPDTGGDPETRTWWEDVDNDGFGNALRPIEASSQPAGTADNDLDCDDLQANVRPDATEVCNGWDDDCDGLLDDDDASLDAGTATTWYLDADGDGHVGSDATLVACARPSGAGPLSDADDCDDADPAVNPDAEEVCGNGLDDDCDGGAGGCRLGAGTYADAEALYLGEGSIHYAGFAIAVGDVNGDGGMDLLMGAPGSDNTSTNGGEVAAFTTPAAGNVRYVDAMGTVGVSAAGFSEAELGSALAFAGDLDGDGIDDFVAGAPGYSSFPGAWATFSGGSSLPASPLSSGTGSGSAECGFAVAGGGDLDGDGASDWVVGCPKAGWGEVTVYAGGDRTMTISATVNGELGAALAIADWNGDGADDLAVGDLDEETVYWFAGPITGDLPASAASGEGPGGADDGCVVAVGDPSGDGYPDLMSGGAQLAEARFYNGGAGDLLGRNIDAGVSANAIAGGDLDGDGVGDLVIGDAETSTVRFYYGPVGARFIPADWLALTGNGNEDFGQSVAIGDVNQDGLADLLVGASQNAAAGVNAGGVYLFAGQGL